MSNQENVMNRWWVVFGAIVIQLCLGSIYAWSVFTPRLVEEGWTKGMTQGVFAAGLASFAIFMVLAGRLMPKMGPRKLAMMGGAILGLGYILGGTLGGTGFWPLFLFVGVIGGAGIGFAYVVPIAVGMRWFPDKKGLITGLAVAGFGFGATLWVKLAGAWGHLIAQHGLSQTFVIYGITFLIAVIIGGLFMVFPPEGWTPAGWSAEQAAAASGGAQPVADLDSGAMLKTREFYMIFFTFICGAGAGLMSIGLMKLFPMKALTSTGMETAAASAIAGTAMAIFFSLANGIGRIAWGVISDSLGRKRSIIIMMATQGIIVILFQWMAGNEYLLYLGATLIGFNFGGNFALFPTITADTFGAKFIGQNYGWVFLAYGVGGIFGPIMGGKLGDMQNFPLAFTICGVLCLVAAGLISTVKPLEQKA
jgi:MFS transporter, OFA family, oxalate/formate antiporter